MKTCSKCGIKKSATIEFFTLDKRHRDGLQSTCRICYKEYDRNRSGSHERKIARLSYYQTIRGRLRHVYHGMKSRCTNLNDKRYEGYGGRGIECRLTSDEFVDYVISTLKIDPRGLQVDRINNDGHYEKGNIRFVTAKVNSNNRRKRIA